MRKMTGALLEQSVFINSGRARGIADLSFDALTLVEFLQPDTLPEPGNMHTWHD